MSTRTIRLRPCPFCGGKAKLEKMGWPHHVYCLSCGVKMTSNYFDLVGEEDVCTKWNRRVISIDTERYERYVRADRLLTEWIDAAAALQNACGGDSDEKHSGE